MNYRKHILSLGIILISAMLFNSCDPDKKLTRGDQKLISLSVSSEGSMTTKATQASPAALPTVELGSGDSGPVYLLGSVTKNTEDHFGEDLTKATILKKDSFDRFAVSVYDGGDLYAQAVAQPEKKFWTLHSETTQIEWPSEHSSMEFYSFTDGSDNPEYYFNPSTRTFLFEAPAETEEIKDFLVAYSKTEHDHEKQNLVPVHFYHALSLIRFDVDGDIRINKITMSSIANKGTVGMSTSHKDFTDFFNWTPDYDNTTSYTIVPVQSKGEILVVPQMLTGTDLRITFNLTTANGTFELTTKAKNLGVDRWTAGYVYNYLISDVAEPKIGIDVIDTMSEDNRTKSAVNVHNTMRSTSYIRANVIGTWCNDADKVVASWHGTLNYKAADWIKIGPYYYYKYPVVGFTSTTNLIDEFKIENAGEKPESVYDLHLELRVTAQAVEFDPEKKNVEKAWGAGVASQLSTNLN